MKSSKKFIFLLILILTSTHLSARHLRRLSKRIPSDQDISKYLQYNEEVVDVPRAWVDFLHATSGSIIGTIIALSMHKWNKTKLEDYSRWGLSVKAVAAFTAKNMWDTWIGIKEVIFTNFFGTNANGLQTKENK